MTEQVDPHENVALVQPAPVPMTYTLRTLRTLEGRNIVELCFQSATGTHHAYFDPEGAIKLANKVTAEARQAMTGLWIPPENQNGSHP
jgi:hypothetical protein